MGEAVKSLEAIAAERVARIRKTRCLAPDVEFGIVCHKDEEPRLDIDGQTVSIVANTDDMDLEDEVVLPSGARGDYFFKNGNLFRDHDTTAGVGKLRRHIKLPNDIKPRMWALQVRTFRTPLGIDTLTLVAAGAMASSIGFIPRDRGAPTDEEVKAYQPPARRLRTVTRVWDWLETSFTLFPCNVYCRASGMDVLSMNEPDDRKMGIVEELLTKSKIRKDTAASYGFPVKLGRSILCRVT